MTVNKLNLSSLICLILTLSFATQVSAQEVKKQSGKSKSQAAKAQGIKPTASAQAPAPQPPQVSSSKATSSGKSAKAIKGEENDEDIVYDPSGVRVLTDDDFDPSKTRTGLELFPELYGKLPDPWTTATEQALNGQFTEQDQTFEQLAEARFGVVTEEQGAVRRVIEVLDESPASNIILPNGQRVSLEPGDFILRVNGTKTSNHDGYINELATSRSLRLSINNPEKGIMNVRTTITSDPVQDVGVPETDLDESQDVIQRFGLTLRTQFDSRGARIQSVAPRSPATRVINSRGQKESLKSSMVISHVEGTKVRNLQHFRELLTQYEPDFEFEVINSSGNHSYQANLND